MRKRERLERALAGESVDRPPVALWRHFPGDDQRFTDLARSIIDFQRDYNWDLVRAMPSRQFMVSDYGLESAWRGDARGMREITKRVIRRSLDWTELRPLTPDRGALGGQVEVMRLVGAALESDETPLLQTIYSPLLQAAQLAGKSRLLRDTRLQSDRLRSGLTQLTESTLRFVEALSRIKSVAGIFFVTGFASHELVSEGEYRSIAMPHNRNIISALPNHWWLNIAQVAGESPMLRLLDELPLQALNWDTEAPGLAEASDRLNCAVCGGLRDEDLLLGTPTLLREAIQRATRQRKRGRLIISGGGEGYITAPISNLRAVRGAVESVG